MHIIKLQKINPVFSSHKTRKSSWTLVSLLYPIRFQLINESKFPHPFHCKSIKKETNNQSSSTPLTISRQQIGKTEIIQRKLEDKKTDGELPEDRRPKSENANHKHGNLNLKEVALNSTSTFASLLKLKISERVDNLILISRLSATVSICTYYIYIYI